MSVVQNAFAYEHVGHVTASLQFFRSTGGTIGLAMPSYSPICHLVVAIAIASSC